MSTRAVGYEEFLAINFNSMRKHFDSLDQYKRDMVNMYQRYLDKLTMDNTPWTYIRN